MSEVKLNDNSSSAQAWPALPFEEWKDTYATLHMWSQIVGKIRLAQTPAVNHWWHVPLYLTARGLTTSPMQYGQGFFEIDFDFIDHRLLIKTSDGALKTIELVPRSVAAFYNEVMSALKSLGMEIHIWTMPVEVPDPIDFTKDEQHASYDAEYAARFWRVLTHADKVFKDFRGRFLGKCSPVHFFWGSFDLAVTRFSGRPAPPREGADPITREAYSHEVISHGLWPGGGDVKGAAFYSYTAPEPAGLKEQKILPAEAFYSREMSEFLLMYDDVRKAGEPETALMEFLQSTYEAGANLANWDREALERK
jgi:hypothetical protein